jgi:hypothetical protein
MMSPLFQGLPHPVCSDFRFSFNLLPAFSSSYRSLALFHARSVLGVRPAELDSSKLDLDPLGFRCLSCRYTTNHFSIMAWRIECKHPLLRLMEKCSMARAFRGLFPNLRQVFVDQ